MKSRQYQWSSALTTKANTSAAAEGLAQQTVKPDGIILVDSGSTDATVRIAQLAGCPHCCISPKKIFPSDELNLGCAAAIGEILLFASAHVYPGLQHPHRAHCQRIRPRRRLHSPTGGRWGTSERSSPSRG